ncbi:hypothetical protein SLEP1_g31356 [Rubroshorea leprosula]|uniref:Uncharacterized protein n=1 Tax=Rubroshorea leprosula TaxID=152421 RepID=A0AAV5K5D1_9ROSI|nr:hypothetical protein SLEP1_g31356 [Rubroshorea leprosula]
MGKLGLRWSYHIPEIQQAKSELQEPKKSHPHSRAVDGEERNRADPKFFCRGGRFQLLNLVLEQEKKGKSSFLTVPQGPACPALLLPPDPLRPDEPQLLPPIFGREHRSALFPLPRVPCCWVGEIFGYFGPVTDLPPLPPVAAGVNFGFLVSVSFPADAAGFFSLPAPVCLLEFWNFVNEAVVMLCENPVCVSCGLPKPCSPCTAREKWGNFDFDCSVTVALGLSLLFCASKWELQTLAHVDMYFCRTGSSYRWDNTLVITDACQWEFVKHWYHY